MFNFLNLNPEYFGLDISDLSLKIVNLKKKKGSFKLVSFSEKEIPKGIIDSGEIKDEDSLAKIIKSSLKEIKGEKIKTNYVVCSLPEEKSYLQVIQMPKMKQEEIENAVNFEAENYIPLPIEDVYLGFQTINPFSGKLDHTDVLIGATPKNIVDPYISVLKKSGLKPLALEIESLSIARSVIKDEAVPYPVLLIDLGATRTSFIIFSGYSIRFTSSIPTSSQDITMALAAALKTDLPKAEDIKRKYGIMGQPKVLLKEKTGDFKFEKEIQEDQRFLELVRPVLNDLIWKIKTYIDYYQAHFGNDHLPSNNKNIEKIVLCGGGANLKGLPEFLTRELKIKTEVGSPLVNIPGCCPTLSIEKSLGFSTALGLAMRKIDL
jgi:type IV pilus assembly protein PilM